MRQLANLRHNATPNAVRALGWSGLLPFIALPILSATGSTGPLPWSQALAAYSFGILCFLLGAWWGLGLARQNASAITLSNGLFVVAFFGFVLLSVSHYLILASVLFVILVAIERRHILFRPQPRYYARMRAALSLTASISLLITASING